MYAIVGLCIAVGILTQWFIERPTRAERKAVEEQRRQLELQQQQYELSIRQQTLDDIARKAAALNAAYASRTPQSTNLMADRRRRASACPRLWTSTSPNTRGGPCKSRADTATINKAAWMVPFMPPC